ncbi:unnamed protein product, partial [Iphiclides podalirius]
MTKLARDGSPPRQACHPLGAVEHMSLAERDQEQLQPLRYTSNRYTVRVGRQKMTFAGHGLRSTSDLSSRGKKLVGGHAVMIWDDTGSVCAVFAK